MTNNQQLRFLSEDNNILENYNNESNNNFKYDNYLLDNTNILNEFKNICMLDGLYLLEAPTGAGKTYLIQQAFKELSKIHTDRLFILACPNRIQNLQNENTYRLVALVGGESFKTLNTNCISMVYDKTYDILDYYRANFNDITLVIDEAHQLIYSNNFRGQALKQLKELQDIATTTIHLTATSRANRLVYNYKKIIECKQGINTNKIDNLKILNVNRSNIDNVLMKLIELEIKENKKIIIHINHIEKINDIYQYLINNNYRVDYLDSSKKECELFNYIVNNSLIPDDVDILLTTNVLEVGTNILNNNVTSIYYLPNNNYINIDSIIQALNRVRTKQNNCYILLNKNNMQQVEGYKSMQSIYDDLLFDLNKELYNIQVDYNTLKKLKHYKTNPKSLVNNLKAIIKSNNLDDYITYNTINNKFELSLEATCKQALNKHDVQYLQDVKLLENILKEKCYISSTKNLTDRNYSNNKINFKLENKTDILEHIKANTDNNLTDYLMALGRDDDTLINILVDRLTEKQLELINIISNKYIADLEQVVKAYKSNYNTCNNKHILSFMDILEISLTSNKNNFRFNLDLKLFARYNKLDVKSIKSNKTTDKYIKLVELLQGKIKNRVNKNLLGALYKEYTNTNKAPSQQDLDKMKLLLEAICKINNVGKISSFIK